ncbi:isopentenyl phosphate kinase-like isoform X2 [Homarus americanus]|uniref:isopentenyl phosphate kinase-like isoform X2 n=1 Tax=Homarus americanus TaxID=6706 RepID=UPI001C471BE2|nr:isopentenyl phosphate kinase-like isoform X2 [Homarus americanus]
MKLVVHSVLADETSAWSCDLNAKVVEQLTDEGLPAVGLSPCGNWTTQDGKVVQSGVSAVSSFLGAGFVPVLHGDCVLDTVTGCTILSGDTVIKTLCKELAVGKVVFLTDVAGIYDKPPQVPGAKLIPNIRVDENGKIVQQITTDALSCDVTGGIELKLSSAVEIVLQSKGTVPVFICQVGSKAAENICIGGEQLAVFEEGTVVTLCREN